MTHSRRAKVGAGAVASCAGVPVAAATVVAASVAVAAATVVLAALVVAALVAFAALAVVEEAGAASTAASTAAGAVLEVATPCDAAPLFLTSSAMLVVSLPLSLRYQSRTLGKEREWTYCSVVREDSRDEVSEPAAVACAICPGMKGMHSTEGWGVP
jgi:hypothetical protein